jgi:hypothetical protein
VKTGSRTLLPGGVLSVRATKGPLSPSSYVESDDSTDSETDYSDDDEEEEVFPLPAAKPADPVKLNDYNVTKAVWHPRSKFIQDDVLIARISTFSELFLQLRDQWKKANELVKQATESKQNSQLPGLKSKTQKQRFTLESTLLTAMKYGHPDILNE